jgi:nucleoside-diphosphate-sugar epimerase
MYIDDLVFIVNKFISNDSIDNNLIYNIGSSVETQIKTLAELILKQLNIDKSIIPLPRLRGSVLRRVPDVTLLKKNIEFQETDLTAGVKKYIEWYIKAGGESNT